MLWRDGVIRAKAAVIENKEILSPASITIRNGIIESISQNVSESSDQSSLIQLDNHLLLPGLTNAHCHLELTGIDKIPAQPFPAWVQALIKNKTQYSDVLKKEGITKGVQDLLRSGTTMIFDHISSDTPLSSYENLPVDVIGFGEVIGLDFEKSETAYQTFHFAQKHAPIPLFPTPHALYSVHPRLIQKVICKEREHFSIHLDESFEEKFFWQKQSGALHDLLSQFATEMDFGKHQSAIDYLKNQHFQLKNSLLVHCNELTEEDFETLKSFHNCCVIHCPGSFHYFKHKSFPFAKLTENHIPVALGTDSLASNTELNLLHEAQLFLTDHPQIDGFDFLNMLTKNALEPLGIKNRGQIQVGCKADLIAFDHYHQESVQEILSQRKQVDWVLTKNRLHMPVNSVC